MNLLAVTMFLSCYCNGSKEEESVRVRCKRLLFLIKASTIAPSSLMKPLPISTPISYI